MIFGRYRRKVEDYSLALKISVVLNVLLIIGMMSTFSFAVKIYANRTVVVKVPPQIPGNNTLVLGVNMASKETIRIFSTYFGQILGNFTPLSVEARLKTMFQYLDPSIEIKEKSRIYKNIHHVKENQITQTFYIKKVNIKLVGDHFDVQIHGTIKRTVGDFGDEIKDIPYMYRISIKIRNGSPYIIKPIKSEFLLEGKLDKKAIEDYKNNNIYIEYK